MQNFFLVEKGYKTYHFLFIWDTGPQNFYLNMPSAGGVGLGGEWAVVVGDLQWFVRMYADQL